MWVESSKNKCRVPQSQRSVWVCGTRPAVFLLTCVMHHRSAFACCVGVMTKAVKLMKVGAKGSPK